MYAYVADRANQRDEFWSSATREATSGSWVNAEVPQPEEIAYWRKHPNLHGWMERLWYERERPSHPNPDEAVFNGIELELTWADIEQLERDVLEGRLPGTQGFFFGEDSDDYYRDQDLAFCRRARAELFLKRRVFYNSSW